MCGLAKEHAGRAVELRHDYAFGAVDYEGALVGHIGDRTEVHVLYHGFEVLVVGVGTVKFEFCFEGYAVGESAFKTFVDCILRRINVIVDEFKYERVARIDYGEVLGEDLEQALVVSLLGWGVELEKIPEGFELHFEEVGIRQGIFYRGEINAGFIVLDSHLRFV